jgi:ankyrin repeat protein
MKHTKSARWNFYASRLLCGLNLALSLLVSCAGQPPPLQEEIVGEAVRTPQGPQGPQGKNEFDDARKLFAGQSRVNSMDEQGRTPLHVAVDSGDYEMMAFLIAMGAAMDLPDRENRTPLAVAVERKDGRSARALVEAGADIHQRQSGGQTLAAASIAIGGDFLRAVLTPGILQSTDSDGRTMLHLAAMEGNPEAVKIVLDEEAKLRHSNLKTADKNGKTALDLALEHIDSKEHFEAAEKLILAGAVSASPVYAHLAPAVRSSNYNTRIGDGIAPLHFAAGEGYAGMTQYLLDKNVDINVKSASGTTPLHEAARSGSLVVMELLLQQGADVRARDAKGNTPMHIAMPIDNQQKALALLLRRGADPNARDEYGESPLHILISLNSPPEAIATLLAGGADVSVRNLEGKTALYLAVQGNRIDSIGALLYYNSDIFAADNNGTTPFSLALRENGPALPALITEATALQSDSQGNTILHLVVAAHAETAIPAFILDKKALVNARNKAGDTALHIAVRDDLQDIGELLIERGADVFANNANGESPLYLSFPEKVPPGTVRQWIINPTTILARDGGGNSILHYIAQWKLDTHIPIIVFKGINPNVPNAMGEPPLFMAVKADSHSTIVALLAAGASIDARDSQGNNGLHAAVRWDAINAAQTLISRAANVNAHALNGKTPLHDAIRWGIIRMETLLIGNGADLEARDNEGNTPFMESIIAGYIASAERLNTMGVDVTIRNNRGDTPLHIAVAQDRLDMVSLLLGWGAKIHARNIVEKTPFQVALATSQRMVAALLTPQWIGVADDNGRSPLHIAVLSDASAEMLKTIIDMGARVSAIDLDGKTSLRLALERDKWEHAKLLADAGSNVFVVAGDGKSPAEIAIAKGREAINAIFSGTAIASQDSAGNTILHYAAQMGSPDLVALLIDLGASKTARNISAESPGDVALKWRRPDIAAMLNS